jgi:hypothetical protein
VNETANLGSSAREPATGDPSCVFCGVINLIRQGTGPDHYYKTITNICTAQKGKTPRISSWTLCMVEIRRAGRWSQEQMEGCYLNVLPRKFMKVMAGHPPQMGCFEIPRADVPPPDELLSMIWPELDAWKAGSARRQARSTTSPPWA